MSAQPTTTSTDQLIQELMVEVRELRAEVRALHNPHPLPCSEWVSTGEAAKIMGIDRATLDKLAPWATQAIPEAVVRVGKGKKRATYRWDRSNLGRAVNAAHALAAQATPKKRR